ncbi:MAG: hypothetical protein ABIQ59_16535 [Nocardioidaceae bacterium]
MVHFEVDPDSLTAAGKVADRQQTHLSRVKDYVGDVCSDTGAFSGVLQIFLGSYTSTLTHANKGLDDSGKVAERVRECFGSSSRTYVESDHASYKTFHKVFGDEIALPPYVAPGGGSTDPGGPLSRPGDPADPKDDEPFKLPKLPPYANDPLDKVMPGEKQELPWYVDPRAAIKDKVLLTMRSKADYDAYVALRSQGYTAEQAQDMVRPDVDGLADRNVYEKMQARQQEAYHSTYDQAILNGDSPDEARTAAQNAASEQHHADSIDHQRRNDILDAGGTYKGAYDQTTSLINHVQSIDKHVDQINEAEDDINDYESYENQDDDRSAQTWAR